ncbi:MAG: alpha/beta fold hydrolase, partial [Kordiimonas sp.]
MFDSPTFVQSENVRIAVHHAGPKPGEADKPAVVFMHGFPELARSFKHQMEALSAEGYPVYAPDMRGYAASDKPDGKEHYGMPKLIGDMTA